MIKSVRIRRFRSIDDMTIDFGDLTMLVGKNDAGKSNVARALNLFFNGHTDLGKPFNFARDWNKNSSVREKTAEEIIIEVTFKLPPSFKESANNVRWKKAWRLDGEQLLKDPVKFTNGRPIPTRGKVRTALERHFVHFAPAIKDARFFEKILGDIYDRLSSNTGGTLANSGEDFNAGLRNDTVGLLQGLGVALGDDFTISLPENLRPIFENLDIRNSKNIPFDRRGDGVKIRHIPELLNFLTQQIDDDLSRTGSVRANHIWVFEEPENNLEFSAAFEMVERLKDFFEQKDNISMLITTHSPVFYGMELRQEAKRRQRYYIDLAKGPHSACRNVDTDDAFHKEMGLLPIVEEFLLPYKEKLEFAIKAKEQIEKNHFDLDKRKVFVEGRTDQLVVGKAFQVFFPEQARKLDVIIAENAGAHSATSYLNAWQLTQKHRENPVRAVALLDHDEEGRSAMENKIQGEHIRSIFLQAAGDNLCKLPPGYKPVVDLESLLSNEVWSMAVGNGWTEERDPEYIFNFSLPSKKKREIIAGKTDVNRFEGLTNAQKTRLENKLNLKAKIHFSDAISKMDDKTAKAELANLKPTLFKVINFLFPEGKQDDLDL